MTRIPKIIYHDDIARALIIDPLCSHLVLVKVDQNSGASIYFDVGAVEFYVDGKYFRSYREASDHCYALYASY